MIEANNLSPIVHISAPRRNKRTPTCTGFIRLLDPREHDRLISLLCDRQVADHVLNPFRAPSRTATSYRILPKYNYQCVECARPLSASNFASPALASCSTSTAPSAVLTPIERFHQLHQEWNELISSSDEDTVSMMCQLMDEYGEEMRQKGDKHRPELDNVDTNVKLAVENNDVNNNKIDIDDCIDELGDFDDRNDDDNNDDNNGVNNDDNNDAHFDNNNDDNITIDNNIDDDIDNDIHNDDNNENIGTISSIIAKTKHWVPMSEPERRGADKFEVATFLSCTSSLFYRLPIMDVTSELGEGEESRSWSLSSAASTVTTPEHPWPVSYEEHGDWDDPFSIATTRNSTSFQFFRLPCADIACELNEVL